MNIPHQVSAVDAMPDKPPGNELAHLLAGLQRQKEELGPIADELIDLLHHLGVDAQAAGGRLLNPSSE